MFYSQFILAKKGPLGTIWIAAHLERKLRKNQVADTDIGVSVDSILFPDVPIALRLSSHLLLGVVRIYSRKVNYLFDDCSEALLKIKQAFRSTAVDLPPEESTAPYHSITLPETFDLDDFELPDSDIFQGNYVDHHVSSREQITLQDTMEGVIYSTSQFGLDERFGDGDTSGLDLDEELLLDKAEAAAEGCASDMLSPDAGLQASDRPMTPLKQDENHEGMTASSETMLVTGDINQIEGVDGDIESIEYAQAPCTPGLLEEPNLSNVQETSACDDQLESENHNLTEFVKENVENGSSKSDIENKNSLDWSLLNHMNSDTVPLMPAENGYHSNDPESSQLRPQGQSPPTAVTMEQISSDNPDSASLPSSSLADQVEALSPVPELSDRMIAASDDPGRVEDLQNGTFSNDPGIHSVDGTHEDCVEAQGLRLGESTPAMSSLTSTCQPVPEDVSGNNQALLKKEVSNNVGVAANLEKSIPLSIALESNVESHDRFDHEKLETLVSQESRDSDKMGCTNVHVLHPCTTYLSQTDMLNPGIENLVDPHLQSEAAGLCSKEISEREEAPHASEASTAVQGEGCHATNGSEQVLEESHKTGPASREDIQQKSVKSNGPADNVPGDGEFEILNGFAGSGLPAPEKILSVPEVVSDVPNNLLVESTPDKGVLTGSDGGGAASQNVSGKKRSFTESALSVQSLNLTESLRVVHTKGTAESIPDDDDLLTSILVGRRSSVLKVKPTPRPEITSMKRPRTAPRISASKRKVLMDDSMVLHGDTIRQQLTNTEDIRRIRKKAPCTRPEISMIQKQLLEEEIFSEPILTGVSTELASLHNQTYDISETRVSQNVVNGASFEAAMDLKLISQNEENVTYLNAAYDMDISIGPNVTEKTGIEGSSDPTVIRDDGEAEFLDGPLLTETQQYEDNTISADIDATQVQMKLSSTVAEPKSSQFELLEEIAEMESDGKIISGTDAVNPVVTVEVEPSCPTDHVSGDACDISADIVQLASFDKTSEADASLQFDEPGVLPDQKLDMLSVEMDVSMMDISSDKGINAAEKNDDEIDAVETESRTKDEFLLEETGGDASVEIRTDIQTDYLEHTQSANNSATFSSETVGCSTHDKAVDQAMEEIRKDEQGVLNENAILDSEVEYNVKNSVSNGICGEENSSYPAEVNVDLRNVSLDDGGNPGRQETDPLSITEVSLDDGENPGRQETDPLSMTEAEISAVNRDDHDDFYYSAVGHDTEFLNVDDDDDDEIAEADDHSMPSAEETRFLENGGWSSRTRAVANYLQTLFDKEAERGRKVLPIDNLLVGKTRKEASRMFFEALVLKTKDYIHVEQETPFDNINIQPRVKLMKLDF